MKKKAQDLQNDSRTNIRRSKNYAKIMGMKYTGKKPHKIAFQWNSKSSKEKEKRKKRGEKREREGGWLLQAGLRLKL